MGVRGEAQNPEPTTLNQRAGVAEQAYASVSKTDEGNLMRVRFSPPALLYDSGTVLSANELWRIKPSRLKVISRVRGSYGVDGEGDTTADCWEEKAPIFLKRS